MKQLMLLFLFCLVLGMTGCPKSSKSTPTVPNSVKTIVDADSKKSKKRRSEEQQKSGSPTDSREITQFQKDMDDLMVRYYCVMGMIAPLNSKGQTKLITKVVKTTNSNTSANTVSDTRAETNANTNSNTSSVTNSNANANTRSTANTTAATNSTTRANTNSNTIAQTEETATTTLESTGLVANMQCGIDLPTNLQERMAIAKVIRNTIINRLLRVINYNYYQFEDNLYTTRSTTSFIGDVLDAGLNLSSIITKGERAKTVLNAVLGSFRQGRKAAIVDFYREQTFEVLVINMQTARDRKKAEMLELMKKPVDEYDLDASLVDVIDYFFAGALPSALKELQITAAVNAKSNKEKVDDQKGLTVNIDKPFSQKLIDTSKVNFGIIRDNLRSKVLLAREKNDPKELGKITTIYEQIYNRIINDPILLPVVTELVGDVTNSDLQSPVSTSINASQACKVGVNGDRNFAQDVKDKKKLTCEDDYHTFLLRINGIITSDEKYAKENERLLSILNDYKETK